MSGLCKVEMSGFMGGRGADGNRAHRDEPTRTGPVASVARGTAKTFEASRSGAAAESNRPPGAPDADPSGGARYGGIVHQLRGRPSNRKLTAALQRKILARVRHR